MILRSLLLAFVSVTPLTAQQTPRNLTLTRDLYLDGEKELFARAPAVAVLKSGEIVLSTEKGWVQYYSAAGARLDRFGRAGEGPGEFQVNVLPAQMGDSLWIVDPTNSRLTWIGSNHKLLSTERLPLGIQISPDSREMFQTMSSLIIPRAMYPNGDYLFSMGRLVKTAKAPWLPEDENSNAVIRTTHAGVFKSRVAVTPYSSPEGCSATLGNSSYALPECPPHYALISRDGSRIAVVFQENRDPIRATATYRVVMLGERGDTIYSRAMQYKPVAYRAGFMDSLISSRPAQFQGPLRALKQPVSYPPVRYVLMGQDGTLWINLRSTTPGLPSTSYLVLDPKGATLGIVVLPKGGTVAWATAARIFVNEEDDDGVVSLARYIVK